MGNGGERKESGKFPVESRGAADGDGGGDNALTRLGQVAKTIGVSTSAIVSKTQALINEHLEQDNIDRELRLEIAHFQKKKADATSSGRKIRTSKPELLWLEEFRLLEYDAAKKTIKNQGQVFNLILSFIVNACIDLDARDYACRFNAQALLGFLKLGQPLLTGAKDGSSLWRIVDRSDFVLSDAAPTDKIRDFLRGGQRIPLWLAKYGSVWRGDLVNRIILRFDECTFLTLHGPAGHGKSVSALQTLAAWAERGTTAIVANSEAALHDAKLEDTCRSLPNVLILLDDIPISRPLPTWLNLLGSPTAVVLQTIQTRKLDRQRSFLGEAAKRMRVPVPQDAALFVDNLIAFDAAFTTDRKEVASLFVNGLGTGNHGGGLWAATWEATHGEKIDGRIGAIVSEIFNDPGRSGDQICLAAATFLNGIIEFDQMSPLHSRLTLDARRSTISQLIENHPDFSPPSKTAALESLNHVGGLLADELLNAGQEPRILDLHDDPLVEFRSASVTHAFYRWLFGAFRGDGDYFISRWPFYSALARVLVQRRAGPADFIGALRSLTNSWSVRPKYQNRYDHGRSQTDISLLAREIYDASPHAATSAKCRIDVSLARALLLATGGANVPAQRKVDLRKGAEIRLLAATIDDAPWDALLDAAGLVSSFDLNGSETLDSLGFSQLIERILASKADFAAKQLARYLRFKWTCLHHQGALFDPSWSTLDAANLIRLRRDKMALGIVHGYLDIISNPFNSNREIGKRFFSSKDLAFGIQSMVSLYVFAIHVFSKDTSLLNILSVVVGPGGAYIHDSGHAIVAGLRRILRATKSVPFRDVFGEELTVIRDRTLQETQNNDNSGLPSWLMESAAILRQQNTLHGYSW